MKNTVFAALLIISFVLSCKKTKSEKPLNNPAKVETSAKNLIKIDSVRIQDSLKFSKNATLSFNNKFLFFEGLEKSVLDSIYKNELYDKSPLGSYTKENAKKYAVQKNKESYDLAKEFAADGNEDYEIDWFHNSEMNVFSQQKGYLTIKYTGDGFEGGAHGYAYENYKVIDVKNQKKLMLQDILEVEKVKWNPVLLKQLKGRENELFEPKELTYNQNFYFDGKGITFVYGQYEIAPYVSGIMEINVPFSEIKTALKPDFIERMKIQ